MAESQTGDPPTLGPSYKVQSTQEERVGRQQELEEGRAAVRQCPLNTRAAVLTDSRHCAPHKTCPRSEQRAGQLKQQGAHEAHL